MSEPTEALRKRVRALEAKVAVLTQREEALISLLHEFFLVHFSNTKTGGWKESAAGIALSAVRAIDEIKEE